MNKSELLKLIENMPDENILIQYEGDGEALMGGEAFDIEDVVVESCGIVIKI